MRKSLLLVRRTELNTQFLPIYEEVYHTLETQSLPNFLQYASTNVNHPKQMFWYAHTTTAWSSTDDQVLCWLFRLPPRCRHLRNPHPPSTEIEFRFPRNPLDIDHIRFIRGDADIFSLEGILLSSMES